MGVKVGREAANQPCQGRYVLSLRYSHRILRMDDSWISDLVGIRRASDMREEEWLCNSARSCYWCYSRPTEGWPSRFSGDVIVLGYKLGDERASWR